MQGCELCGQEHFEWNTDHFETKKLENYTCQVAQELYSGEAQHERYGSGRGTSEVPIDRSVESCASTKSVMSQFASVFEYFQGFCDGDVHFNELLEGIVGLVNRSVNTRNCEFGHVQDVF